MRSSLAAMLVSLPGLAQAQTITGDIAPDRVEEVIRAHAGEIAQCRRAKPWITVPAEFTISAAGTVKRP
jgi:hypothetical protein